MDNRSSRYNLPNIDRQISIHFTGIGGIGMSGLARICLELGATVTGSDLRENDQTRQLTALGAKIYLGTNPAVLETADLMVYSTAVPETHPEREHARLLQIPAIRRGTMLAHLVAGRELLAVAGTHGKTTTSSMLALAALRCGLDPTIILGGELKAIQGNAHLGQGPICVAETDESDASFLELDPSLAIVTNIEDDHLEYYGDLDSLQGAFIDFIERVPEGRHRILCADAPILMEIAQRHFGDDYVTYGFSPDSDLRGERIHLTPEGSECLVSWMGTPLGRLFIPIPGQHMLTNALSVVATAVVMQWSIPEALAGLSRYHGTRRRFEQIGTWRGANLVDDYGHHPTEIRATLKSLNQTARGRSIVVFQPHRYSRTEQFFDEFCRAFEGVEILILTDIYAASEQPRAGISSKFMAENVSGVRQVFYAPSLNDVEKILQDLVQAGDTVLFLGAGDVNKVGYHLVKMEQSGL